MVESMSLMGLVAIFISIAIFLSIGIMLLDSATSDCSTLTGYNSANPSASTDWAKSCVDNNTGVQNSWLLISVILVVVASIIVHVSILLPLAFTNAIFVDAERDGHKWLKEWKEEQNRYTLVTNRLKKKNLVIWNPNKEA